jgi:hypothetical protein
MEQQKIAQKLAHEQLKLDTEREAIKIKLEDSSVVVYPDLDVSNNISNQYSTNNPMPNKNQQNNQQNYQQNYQQTNQSNPYHSELQIIYQGDIYRQLHGNWQMVNNAKLNCS